jgi:hypothetical protein
VFKPEVSEAPSLSTDLLTPDEDDMVSCNAFNSVSIGVVSLPSTSSKSAVFSSSSGTPAALELRHEARVQTFRLGQRVFFARGRLAVAF